MVVSPSARKVIAESVIPAYRRFTQVFQQAYLPACRETVGIWDTPNGEAFYRDALPRAKSLRPRRLQQ